jgi:predicted cobalt transporter CbtA
MSLAGKVLRLVALAEFAAALTAWKLGALDWGLACIIATLTLIVGLGGLESDPA